MPFLEQIPQSILCCLHVVPYIILKWVQRLFKVLWNNSSNIYEVFAEINKRPLYIYFLLLLMILTRMDAMIKNQYLKALICI